MWATLQLRPVGANVPAVSATKRARTGCGRLWARQVPFLRVRAWLLRRTPAQHPRCLSGAPMSLLSILLIVALVIAIGGGGIGHSRYGYAGWSPAGILLLIIGVLWFTGNLHR